MTSTAVPTTPRWRVPRARPVVALLLTSALLASSCGNESSDAGSADDIGAAPTTSSPAEADPSDDVPDSTDGIVGTSPGDAGPDEDAPATTGREDATPARTVDGADPLIGEQWGLDVANVPMAWTTTGGEGVVIAVIDSGVDLDHPDLVDRLVPGWDFVDGDDQPDDPNGHGTHVAGIAAASSNGIGIAGAAPLASIMPIRVLDADGAGSDEVIAESIRWAADNGAEVVNLSLGESGFISRFTRGSSLNAAIREVSAQGVVVVAAAGNEGAAGQQYRIGVDLLVVNATGPDGTLTSFSNVGDVRAISAPGAMIVSTAPTEPTAIWPNGSDGYEPLDGTSMAAPLVSGIAALAIAAGEDPSTVIDLLAETAANPTGDPRLGSGIVDASAALGLSPVLTPAQDPDAPLDPPDEDPGAPADPPAEDPDAPADPPGEVPDPADVEEQLREIVAGLDTTVDATCTVARRLLTVEMTLPDNGLGLQIVAEVFVAGFSGAGSYPATGAVTATAPNQAPVTAPVAAMAEVTDSGSGAIPLPVDGDVSASLAWRCV